MSKVAELLKEVQWWHSDPDSPDYNECDVDPCQWCIEAGAAIAGMPRWRDAVKESPEDGALVWVSGMGNAGRFYADAKFDGTDFWLWHAEADEYIVDTQVDRWMPIAPLDTP